MVLVSLLKTRMSSQRDLRPNSQNPEHHESPVILTSQCVSPLFIYLFIHVFWSGGGGGFILAPKCRALEHSTSRLDWLLGSSSMTKRLTEADALGTLNPIT